MQVGQDKMLSVVITCYNGQRFLPTFFNCLDNQTYKNLQIIFVNDGSTDGSLGLIKNFCKDKKGYLWVDTTNQGVASAKDMGLVMACGEYVTFCDVDDLLHPRHFEQLVSVISEGNADMGVCSFKRVKDSRASKIKFNKLKSAKIQTAEKIDAMQTFFSQEKYDFVLWNKIFSLKTVKQSGARFLQGTRYGEESYFIYALLKASKLVAYKKVKTYFYIQHKNSLMHVKFNDTRLDIFKNIDLVYQDCKANFPSVSPYVSSMRAGYSCGMLYFMKKSKFDDAKVVSGIIQSLKTDCKQLKKCKKTALYKRLFIPIVVPVAKLVFAKTLKKVNQTVVDFEPSQVV